MGLKEFFQEHPQAALAFSGGVDSAYLLYAGVRAGAKIKAYYVKTAFQPRFELEDAERLAKELGAEMEVLHADVLCRKEIVENPPDRCYHCKSLIFETILEAARKDGFSLILDGTNASDSVSDRPGMRALRELGVRSPLREAGLCKEEIRRRSREAGLFTWDKSAYACLATRIPTGEEITREKLEKTEMAEDFLSGLGLKGFRVRLRQGSALIQVREKDFEDVLKHREEILKALKNDYSGVYLDMEERNEF